ncbi:hypothetical protein RUMGNA_02033 [Mediterraneibacter gnavus ATCC 29149]|uniref:Uncharacterized protein n=2 Tax=Lachnospiraceae TaxID=186803 RepID=C9LCR4_BLAHA|nr:hypothetical protein RUMGNA_02033 [Mediterraneibacter gnavus ATCC 29149]EEX20193.1 hypothetical protein BLAHAN_07224 [Blautia hansenii DSM 20583]
MLLSVLICFYGKKISVSEFLRSARSSFLLFPIKKKIGRGFITSCRFSF